MNYIWENIGGFFWCWLAINFSCGLGFFFLFKKCQKRRWLKLKIVIFNGLLLIVLLNSLFFAAEAYFRFIFDYSDTIGDLKTNQRWLARHVVTNLDHFRDRDFKTTKEKNVKRLAVLGDSFAYGWGVDVNQRFSNLLEEKLNQAQKSSENETAAERFKYEVYNTAVPGWESKDELEFLKTRAGLFKFDTVILSYFLNDIYHDRAFDLDFMDKRFKQIREIPLLKPLLARSFFLEFITVHFLNFFNDAAKDISQRELRLYRDERSWQNHQQTLKAIIEECRRQNQQLLVIIFPYLHLVNQQPYPAAFVHQKLTEFFNQEQTEVIDLYPVLKHYPVNRLRANPYDMHPSALVHQVAAELLYERLKTLK